MWIPLVFLFAFGLIGLLSPGWLMACCGLGSALEDEACIVWFFRILGAVLIGIGIWYLFTRVLFGGPGGH